MSSNPVKNVDGEYVAGEIALLRTTNLKKTFILVEGISDEFIYKKFIDQKNCDIVICYSSSAIVKGVSILNKNKVIGGYLAIKDADFDKLNKFIEPNILITDGHDLENMICQSVTLDYFIESRLLEGDIKSSSERNIEKELIDRIKNDIRERLFHIGGLLGYIQWVAIKQRWGIEIKVPDLLSKYLDSNCNVTINSCIDDIKNKYNHIDETKYSEHEFHNLMNTYPYHLCCNGHDLVFLLSNHVFPNIIKKHLKKEIKPGSLVANNFLLAYNNYEVFQTTQLFLDIRKWENENLPFKVLR